MRRKLQDERELEETRRKLCVLEGHFKAIRQGEASQAHLEALDLRAVRRTTNQLKEEVSWCEAHLAAGEKPPGVRVGRLRGIGFREWRHTMIPKLDEHGNLPPGIHRATLAEIEERFGKSTEVRRAQIQSLHWLVDAAKRAGIERLIVNGSFVTDVLSQTT